MKSYLKFGIVCLALLVAIQAQAGELKIDNCLPQATLKIVSQTSGVKFETSFSPVPNQMTSIIIPEDVRRFSLSLSAAGYDARIYDDKNAEIKTAWDNSTSVRHIRLLAHYNLDINTYLSDVLITISVADNRQAIIPTAGLLSGKNGRCSVDLAADPKAELILIGKKSGYSDFRLFTKSDFIGGSRISLGGAATRKLDLFTKLELEWRPHYLFEELKPIAAEQDTTPPQVRFKGKNVAWNADKRILSCVLGGKEFYPRVSIIKPGYLAVDRVFRDFDQAVPARRDLKLNVISSSDIDEFEATSVVFEFLNDRYSIPILDLEKFVSCDHRYEFEIPTDSYQDRQKIESEFSLILHTREYFELAREVYSNKEYEKAVRMIQRLIFARKDNQTIPYLSIFFARMIWDYYETIKSETKGQKVLQTFESYSAPSVYGVRMKTSGTDVNDICYALFTWDEGTTIIPILKKHGGLPLAEVKDMLDNAGLTMNQEELDLFWEYLKQRELLALITDREQLSFFTGMGELQSAVFAQLPVLNPAFQDVNNSPYQGYDLLTAIDNQIAKGMPPSRRAVYRNVLRSSVMMFVEANHMSGNPAYCTRSQRAYDYFTLKYPGVSIDPVPCP